MPRKLISRTRCLFLVALVVIMMFGSGCLFRKQSMKLKPNRVQTLGKLGVVVFGSPIRFGTAIHMGTAVDPRDIHTKIITTIYVYMTPDMAGFDYVEALAGRLVEELRSNVLVQEVVCVSSAQRGLVRVPAPGWTRRDTGSDFRKWNLDVTQLQADGLDTVLVVTGTHASMSEQLKFLHSPINSPHNDWLHGPHEPYQTFGLCPEIWWTGNGFPFSCSLTGAQYGYEADLFPKLALYEGLVYRAGMIHPATALLIDVRTNTILAWAFLNPSKGRWKEVRTGLASLVTPFTELYNARNGTFGVMNCEEAWSSPHEISEPARRAVVDFMSQETTALAARVPAALGLL